MKRNNYKAQIKILEEDIEDQKGFVRFRDDKIKKYQANIKNLLIKIKRLEYRLDACLYSMILMQNQVRKFEENCEEHHMEKPSIAG